MDEINLKQIITNFPDCVTNGAKLKAILLDTYPEISKAIVNTLVIMANSGIAKEIQDSENITELDKSRWQKKLEDDYGLSNKIILDCIDILTKNISESCNLSDFVIENGVLNEYKGSASIVKIPDCVTKIEGAFFKNIHLKKIFIPDTVTYIGDTSFYGCKNLTEIDIPDSVTYIGNLAFCDCESIIKISIPKNITTIRSGAFDNCNNLTDVFWNVEDYKCQIFSDDYSEHYSYCDEDCSYEYLDARVFRSCEKLKNITIGKDVKSIPASIFKCCDDDGEILEGSEEVAEDYNQFKNIFYDGTITDWCKIKGLDALLTEENSLYIGGKEIKGDIVIPKDVTSIESFAFYGRDINVFYSGTIADWCKIKGLDELLKEEEDFLYSTEENSLYIEDKRIKDEVIIPDGVTTIEAFAFYGRSKITSIRIPQSVVSIGNYAFAMCPSLLVITYEGTKAQWECINKENFWSGDIKEVHCKDGIIKIV